MSDQTKNGAPRRVPHAASLLILTAVLLTGCVFSRPEAMSPGEVPIVPVSRRTGDGNPARYVVGVVKNADGQILLSRCMRVENRLAPCGGGTPSGGENALPWTECEALLLDSKVNFLLLRDVLHEWFDVFAHDEWILADGRLFTRVRWFLLSKEDVDLIWAMRGGEGPDEYMGLKWALAFGQCEPGESAWQAVTRAVQETLGAPASQLEEEYFWVNPATATAYFRLRYTGAPDDQFVLNDPDFERGRAYRSEAAWASATTPALRLLAACLHTIEQVPAARVKAIMGGGQSGGIE